MLSRKEIQSEFRLRFVKFIREQSMLFVLPCNVCVIMWFQELLENLFQRTTDWIYNYSILIKNECFPWYTIMSSHTCSQSQSQRRNCSFHLKIFPLSFSSIDFNRKKIKQKSSSIPAPLIPHHSSVQWSVMPCANSVSFEPFITSVTLLGYANPYRLF